MKWAQYPTTAEAIRDHARRHDEVWREFADRLGQRLGTFSRGVQLTFPFWETTESPIGGQYRIWFSGGPDPVQALRREFEGVKR